MHQSYSLISVVIFLATILVPNAVLSRTVRAQSEPITLELGIEQIIFNWVWGKIHHLILVAVFIAMLTGGMILVSTAHAQSESIIVELGPEEIIFDSTTDRCSQFDIPDAPARAFRDAENQIHLIATHVKNRQKVGPDFDSMLHDCDVILSSGHNPDPTSFDDNEFIASVYTENGIDIYATLHVEYHGDRHVTPEDSTRCPSGDPLKCSYFNVTAAFSNDMGTSYSHANPPDHLVASIPYSFSPDLGPIGPFGAANIIKKDDFYYRLLNILGHEEQQRGVSLMRTHDLKDPKSWRCWDGEGFNVELVNPYFPDETPPGQPPTGFDPANHVCQILDNVGGLHQSLSYNTYLQKYLLVSHGSIFIEGKLNYAFLYSLSDDLINWLPRQLFWDPPRSWGEPATNSIDARHGYPSLIDPSVTSFNFEITDNEFHMYYTIWYHAGSLDRDLGRRTVTLIDDTPPVIEISAPSVSIANAATESVSYTVSYSDIAAFHAQLTKGDITLSKTESADGDYTVTKINDTTWTVNITNLSGEGTLGFSIQAGTAQDVIGNASGSASALSFDVDAIVPTVSISEPSALVTSGGPVIYTVGFEGADEVTLDRDPQDKFLLGKTGSVAGEVISVEDLVDSGEIDTWRVEVRNLSGDGSFKVRVQGGDTAVDAAGNRLVGTTFSDSTAVVVDNTPPSVSVSEPNVVATNSGPVEYTVTYADDRSAVTVDLDPSDLRIDGRDFENKSIAPEVLDAVTKTVTSINENTRLVTLDNILWEGTLNLRVIAGTASDAAGNLAPFTPFGPTTRVIVDKTPPTMSISEPDVSETATGPVVYTLTYTGADAVNLTEGDINVLTLSGTATGEVLPFPVSLGGDDMPVVTIGNISGNGSLAISVAGGTASDVAGNEALGAGPSEPVLVDDTDTDEDGEPDLNDLDDDNDGLEDVYEEDHDCLDPLVAEDANQDGDGDGLTSLEEFTISAQLNPCDADTDGDKIDDLLDSDPLIGDNVCSGSDEAVFIDEVQENEEVQCGAAVSITVSPNINEFGLLRLISPKVIFNAGRVSGELKIDSSHPCTACTP